MMKSGHQVKAAGFSMVLFLALALFFAACQRSSDSKTPASVQAGGATQGGTPAQAPAKKPALYRCPMHPTFTSDKPGSCGICGMDLVLVEEEEQAAAAAPAAQPAPKKKTMYRSTMMPNEISDKPGKDSMGMEMVPFEVEEAAPSRR